MKKIDVAAAQEIRIASIDARHIDDLARLHRAAFRGSMNARLGDGYARALIAWFRRGDERIALEAMRGDGEPIGYVLGAPVGYARRMNRDLARNAAGGLLRRPWLLVDREFRATLWSRLRLLVGFSRAATAPPQLPEPTMSLVGIGVSSASRGEGVGSLLMAEFERRARALGMKSMRLSVRIDNAAAVRCYEKNGWRLCAAAAELPSVRYYSKRLDAAP